MSDVGEVAMDVAHPPRCRGEGAHAPHKRTSSLMHRGRPDCNGACALQAE